MDTLLSEPVRGNAASDTHSKPNRNSHTFPGMRSFFFLHWSKFILMLKNLNLSQVSGSQGGKHDDSILGYCAE